MGNGLTEANEARSKRCLRHCAESGDCLQQIMTDHVAIIVKYFINEAGLKVIENTRLFLRLAPAFQLSYIWKAKN